MLYGRNLKIFRHDLSTLDLDDPDFVPGKKSLSSVAKKIVSTLARVRKNWTMEYLNFLALKDPSRQRMAPTTKSVLIPATGDGVLIKDGKSLRVGKILEVFSSDDSEFRSARVRTQGGEGVYPICNLRFLERSDSDVLTAPVPSDGVEVRKKRPQRKAAAEAQAKIMAIHLIRN